MRIKYQLLNFDYFDLRIYVFCKGQYRLQDRAREAPSTERKLKQKVERLSLYFLFSSEKPWP